MNDPNVSRKTARLKFTLFWFLLVSFVVYVLLSFANLNCNYQRFHNFNHVQKTARAESFVNFSDFLKTFYREILAVEKSLKFFLLISSWMLDHENFFRKKFLFYWAKLVLSKTKGDLTNIIWVNSELDEKRALIFHDGGPYHIEASPLVCPPNQWTDFYIIRTSVVKELV